MTFSHVVVACLGIIATRGENRQFNEAFGLYQSLRSVTILPASTHSLFEYIVHYFRMPKGLTAMLSCIFTSFQKVATHFINAAQFVSFLLLLGFYD